MYFHRSAARRYRKGGCKNTRKRTISEKMQGETKKDRAGDAGRNINRGGAALTRTLQKSARTKKFLKETTGEKGRRTVMRGYHAKATDCSGRGNASKRPRKGGKSASEKIFRIGKWGTCGTKRASREKETLFKEANHRGKVKKRLRGIGGRGGRNEKGTEGGNASDGPGKVKRPMKRLWISREQKNMHVERERPTQGEKKTK